MQIPLTRGIKTSIESQYSDALLENMIVSADPVLGSQGYVSSHHGLKSISSPSIEGESRGGVYNDRFNLCFRVIGNQLVSTLNNGKIGSYLGVVEGEGQVSMPFSFNTQAVITQQGKMYLYDQDAGFREVTDKDLGDVFDGTWIDGYYFLVDSESPIVTDILAEDSIRQLNYGSAEIDPDPIRGCDKWRNFAVVFGSSTMEHYDNVGGTLFPFSRVESYTIYVGIVGTHAKAKLPNDEGFIILGGARNDTVSFHFAVNGSSKSISTKEVDRILAKYTENELSTSKLEYIKHEDQEFIYAHLPSHTLVYDITTSNKLGYYQWSVLKTGWCVQKDFKGYWQAINAVKMPFLNNYTFGNRNDSSISELDSSTCDQYDEQQEHVIFTPLFRDSRPYSIDNLQPQITNGNNKISRDESLFLSATEDGRSFSTEVNERFGERGARWEQVIWRRLGLFRNWAGFRLRYIGKTNLTMSSLEVNK